jgi:succinate dehydrogenase / fumarate reductase cytochrome b subunit
MLWSGPMLLAFIVYHLLHFTTGQAHPNFQYLKVYDNMVAGFRQVPASIAYIVAMCFLGLHLYHGIWSMFQSVGFSHPRYTPRIKAVAAVLSTLIVGGNISIPLAVLTGIIS